MPEARPLNVFIAHASQDKPAVRKLYQALSKETWISPWLDEEELLPGMDWNHEIEEALHRADIFIACLSQESVAKEGYVQREFKRALSYAEEKPEGTIYVIPLRLDDCTPPRKLNKYQWVDYFESNAQEKLLKSLKIRAETLGVLGKIVSKKSENSSFGGMFPHISEWGKDTSISTKASEHKIHTFAGMEFMRIPAGEFWMGANDIDDFEDAAKPEHLVYLEYDFYMARFPLTNRLYARKVRDRIVSRDDVQYPVVGVSWYDAQEYIAWLNAEYASALPFRHRFCLPSEAEWEKAARGPEGNDYPWGREFDKNKCNTKENGIIGTSIVEKYSPQGDSCYGVADIAGNVWEWTRSLWGNNWEGPSFIYPYHFDNEREDDKAGSGIYRVLRGGSWDEGKNHVHCAFRSRGNPVISNENRGFRVAVSPFSP